MTDKFLQKILDATEEMRNQDDCSCDRELSPRAKNIREYLRGVTAVSLEIMGYLKRNFDDVMYAEDEKPRTYQPVKWAVVYNEREENPYFLRLIIHGANVRNFTNYWTLRKTGEPYKWELSKAPVRPATIAEIHEFYEELIK